MIRTKPNWYQCKKLMELIFGCEHTRPSRRPFSLAIFLSNINTIVISSAMLFFIFWGSLYNTNHYMRSHMRGRGAVAGRGGKTAPQEMGPTPNLPCLLRNCALQTIIVLKKWQIRPRPLRVCVNIPAVAEREFQNPPASAPQPPRACVNVALVKRASGTGSLVLNMDDKCHSP